MKTRRNSPGSAARAWMAVGGLAAAALVLLAVRELPAIRREMRMLLM